VKKILVALILLLPITASAQSMEWLRENPGSTTPAISQVTPPPPSINTNEGLEGRVRAYFSDSPIMGEIARCESRFRQFNSSGSALDGGAGGMIGIFQINSHVHTNFAKSIGMDIYSVEGNLAYARYLYEREGTDPWLSSFSCWNQARTTNATPSNTLSQDLYLGVISPEVRALQVLLNSKGFTLTTEGPGSPGQETDKFGSLTRAAVRKFQCSVLQLCSGSEHVNGYGMVNANTRAALLGAAAQAVSPPPAQPEVSAEIERLQKMIAELSAQLFALKQKAGQ
jgi:hypothetical protein